MNEYTLKDVERFWSKVDKSGGPDACWPYTERCNASGYGQFHYGSRVGTGGRWRHLMISSRVAWELTNGAIPEGILVCHACDNPPCCNPTHLWLGTPADNTKDMYSKCRNHPRPHGWKGDAIRSLYSTGRYSQRELAKAFSVSQPAVNHAIKRFVKK